MITAIQDPTQEQLIEQIQNAHSLQDIVSNVNDCKDDLRKIFKQIHPDVCSLPGASDATAKLLSFQTEFEEGVTLTDETGPFKTNGYWSYYKGDAKLLKWSYENFLMLKQVATSTAAIQTGPKSY